MPIPSSYARYIIPDLPTADELLPYLRRIDANQWYSNFGPLALEFEEKFAAAMASAHGGEPFPSLALATGYHGLVVALALLGIGPGSRVLLPGITFPACPHAVERLGAEAILGDVDLASWTLTPAIARAIAARTKIDAVMPVALYGIPVPAAAWDAFSADTGIPVVIDAAAAVESQRYLKHGYVVHSLHALKPFGIGEGGLLVTADGDKIQAARTFANFGTFERITLGAGENAKISEYHAAVALAQLQRWDGIKQRRQQVYRQYRQGLAKVGLEQLLHTETAQVVLSSLMLRVSTPYAPDLLDQLRQHNVFGHRTYLPPLYEHPYFTRLAQADSNGTICSGAMATPGFLTNCAALNRTVIGLPFHAFMTPDEINRAVAAFTLLLQD